jgi:hypothetical protein
LWKKYGSETKKKTNLLFIEIFLELDMEKPEAILLPK